MRNSIMALALAAAGLSAAPLTSAHAQRTVDRSASELLAAFTSEHDPASPAAPPGARADLTHVLAHPQSYAPVPMRSLLDGLERIARTGSSHRMRVAALLAMSYPGSRRHAQPVPGSFARLVRVYQQSEDGGLKGVAVSLMAHVPERQEALNFLEQLAKQAPEEVDAPYAAHYALSALAAMGAEGRAVLKRLHESGAVKDPDDRYTLELMAKRGYRH